MTLGPYFDELRPGQVFDTAPAMTLTSGVAAVHQSILGDRLPLSLDAGLAAAVTGASAPLAHPALVCDVAIGQSTPATQRVKANLFYRGLAFHRYPQIGATLRTRTEVVGLRENSAKPDRAPTGLAALRMTTVDDDDRVVLDFHRCAMLPLSPGVSGTGHRDDLSSIGVAGEAPDPSAAWRHPAAGRVPPLDPETVGAVLSSSADVVTGATDLARLTLNIAAVHHDSRVTGRRLVYGGHTIGLALAQASRLLPGLASVLGWESCDHTGPVYEGDTLHSDLHVLTAQPREDWVVLGLRSVVYAVGGPAEPDRQVLDWRFTALHF